MKHAKKSFKKCYFNKCLCSLILIIISSFLVSCKSDDYKKAEEFYSSADYSSALEIYSELGDYKDSGDKAIICKYNIAEDYYNKEKYKEAKSVYEELGDYKDSKDKTLECEKEINLSSKADKAFLSDIEASILNRMKHKDSDDLTSLVNTELAYLEKYKDAEFYDQNLKELAKDYIEGLNTQKDSFKEEYESDEDLKWQRGLVQRYEVLNKLYDEYGFLSDNAEFVASYVIDFENQKMLLDAHESINKDVNEQLKDTEDFEIFFDEYDSNIGTMEGKVTNNTSYTYSATFDLTLRDANSVIFCTASDVKENIKPGDTYTVSFDVDITDCETDDINWEWYSTYYDIKKN